MIKKPDSSDRINIIIDIPNTWRYHSDKETNIGFLTIDHINGGGEKHRKELKLNAGTQFYRWLRNNGYPEGYQVMCYNCNCGKAKNGNVCPHKEPEKLKDIYNIANF
jgi:hypothetical protein